MKIKGINHVGFVVKDIEKTISFYKDAFGATSTPVMINEDMGVKVALVNLGGGQAELFSPVEQPPAGSRGDIYQEFINSKGEGITHLALEVDDVEAALQELEQKGITPIDKVPRPGLFTTVGKIAYVNHEVELCQP